MNTPPQTPLPPAPPPGGGSYRWQRPIWYHREGSGFLIAMVGVIIVLLLVGGFLLFGP